MPMFKALKACPDAVVIPPGHGEIRARRPRGARADAGADARGRAAVDRRGVPRPDRHRAPARRAAGARSLARFQQRVEREIGITVSIGLSHNKFLAKIASDLDKPRGFAVIGRAETLAFLAAQPVSVIWGVGKAMQERLARDGLTHASASCRSCDERDARQALRRDGAAARAACRAARTTAPSRPSAQTKSISAETTFDTRHRRPPTSCCRSCARCPRRCRGA